MQTALLQDEALKRANAAVGIQAEVGGGEEPQQRQGRLLDSMRDALGLGEPRGSVPNVRPAVVAADRGAAPSLGADTRRSGRVPAREMPPPGYGGGPAFGTSG